MAFSCPFRVQWRQIPEKQDDFVPLNRLVHRKRGQGRRQGRIRRRGTGRYRPASSEPATECSVEDTAFQMVQFVEFFFDGTFLQGDFSGQCIELVGDAALFGERGKGNRLIEIVISVYAGFDAILRQSVYIISFCEIKKIFKA